MSLNDKLLKAAAAEGITPSEHFGVMLYEGDGSSSHSINGGKFGGAASFNGSNGEITLPAGIQSSKMSVSLWLYSHDNAPTDKIVIEFSNGYGLNFNTVGAGKIAAQYANSNSSHILSNSTISSGQWYHIVGVFNSSSAALYINGSSQSGGTVTDYLTSDQNTIGSRRTGQYFDGKIDQVRIFNKELSSSEVSTLYAETASTVESLDPLSEDTTDTLQVLGDTSCIALYKFENNENDKSGNHSGTGTQIQYAAGRYGQAASFNNTADSKMVIGAMNSVIPNNTTGVSFSFWVYLDSVNTGSDYDHWFVGQENYGGSFDNGEFSVRLYEGKVYTDYAQSSSIYRQRKASTTLETNRWYHIVATYDTSNANITEVYLNGVSETSSNLTSGGTFTTTALMQSSANMSVGGGPTGTDGRIDQFRIFTKVLSASEVTTLYNENSLVASYRFEGNSLDDKRTFNGTDSNVTYEFGVDFKPDLVWIKDRDNAEQHILNDSTRGATKDLSPDRTNAEATRSTGFLSFDNGGFTLGSDGGGVVNDSSRGPYVAWCWKANGGTTSSNTDGSITSTVQANTDAGFSIVKYTGTGSTGTYGHGLSSSPDWIITKRTDAAEGWLVWSSSLSASNYIYLNGSGAAGTDTNAYKTIGATTNQIGGDVTVNTSGGTYISYCFHNVDGFSKFGSYAGNGSNDGTMVETGFEPAFVMIKDSSEGHSWTIHDNKRDLTNPRKKYVLPSATNVEAADLNGINFYSNGFQLLDDYQYYNKDGNTYIYMAFAADPDTEAPTVARSFSTVAYDGTSSTQSIEGLNFKPGLIWMKRRSSSQEHALVNIVSGVQKHLYSDLTSAEQTTTNGVSSFNDDGWTMGSNGLMNYNGTTYVAWAWAADDNEATLSARNATAIYKMEDNVNDVTGNNNASSTSITYSSGKFNKAANFTGGNSQSGSQISVNNSVLGSSSTGPWSISLWFKADNTAGEVPLVGNGGTVGGTSGFVLYLQNGSLSLSFRTNPSQEFYESIISLNDNNYHHVVMTYDNGPFKIYVDNVLVKSGTSSNYQNNTTPTYDLFFGNRWNRNDNNAVLNGQMDQIRIYKGIVSDIGVEALYNEADTDNNDLSLGGPAEIVTSTNANAGFSIVKYEGTGVAGAKIPHGLSAAPEMVISKSLDSTNSWNVYHTSLSTNYMMKLNSSNAAFDATAGTKGGGITVDATNMTILAGASNQENNNKSGDDFIAYCWHSVSGYSKISSYTGNGGTQSITGLGFQPDWVLIKENDGVDSWQIYDSVRGAGKVLYPNGNNAEYAGSELSSFNSDGFTVTGNPNENGKTYMYMAFKIN
tara:strand:- start:733 stop:4689 length:3957 start_codon:yes stop_codon:yes gene_type:complete